MNIALWCNGSTTDFGSVGHGSSPCSATDSDIKVIIFLMLKKCIILTVFLLLGLFVGNHVFNHIHAWCGIGIILFSITYFIYKLIKIFRHEEFY